MPFLIIAFISLTSEQKMFSIEKYECALNVKKIIDDPGDGSCLVNNSMQFKA